MEKRLVRTAKKYEICYYYLLPIFDRYYYVFAFIHDSREFLFHIRSRW
jgi:hypothetical protein